MRDQVPHTFNGIMLFGEAPGYEEEKAGRPFIGAAGQLLTWMLEDAGIVRDECYITNVFLERPRANNIDLFFKGRGASKKVIPSRQGDIDRIPDLIRTVNPRIIIACGNTPLWALLNSKGIMSWRGYVGTERLSGLNVPVMCTIHPAGVLRQYTLRPFVIKDFQKANAWTGEDPFTVHVCETLDDVRAMRDILLGASIISADVETKQKQITHASFSVEQGVGYVVHIRTDDGRNAWSAEDEIEVWRILKEIFESNIPKLGQNLLYDTQYLLRSYGIRTRGVDEDTMLLHHALYCELRKSLEVLTSVYTCLPRYKHLLQDEKDS